MRDAEIVELALRRVAAARDCDISSPSATLTAVANQIALIIREGEQAKLAIQRDAILASMGR